jgi:hypothetical protein
VSSGRGLPSIHEAPGSIPNATKKKKKKKEKEKVSEENRARKSKKARSCMF